MTNPFIDTLKSDVESREECISVGRKNRERKKERKMRGTFNEANCSNRGAWIIFHFFLSLFFFFYDAPSEKVKFQTC